MKTFLNLLLMALFASAPSAFAANIAHIAAGDCNALSAAAASSAGHEPALIVLARNARYANCDLHVSGSIAIDGAGARMQLLEQVAGLGQVTVAAGARLTLRNLNFARDTQAAASVANSGGPKAGTTFYDPAIRNDGSLVLDRVSLSGVAIFAPGKAAGGLLANHGALSLRNSTITANTPARSNLIFGDGSAEISHSTFAKNSVAGIGIFFGTGKVSIANSVFVANETSCAVGDTTQITSLGGNVTDDAGCHFNAASDRLIGDARLLDFSRHGGVVDTFALDYDSPAIGNGLAANCEAADARGLSRGTTRCDSGAYEVGGGNGKLSSTGMSGLYFNAANNGHYVSIQKLFGNQALVIWNTFDEHGVPAWLYGVGTIGGNQIHVPQVAQNIGGKLHQGGSVDVSTPTLWGSFDVTLSDCYNATLSYSSPLPQFGTGSTTLQRLAFLDGVNCAL